MRDVRHSGVNLAARQVNDENIDHSILGYQSSPSKREKEKNEQTAQPETTETPQSPCATRVHRIPMNGCRSGSRDTLTHVCRGGRPTCHRRFGSRIGDGRGDICLGRRNGRICNRACRGCRESHRYTSRSDILGGRVRTRFGHHTERTPLHASHGRSGGASIVGKESSAGSGE